MRFYKHLTNLLLIVLLALSATGTVSAKVASGPQNLGSTGHQAQSVFNLLTCQGKTESSTTVAPECSVVPKGEVGSLTDGVFAQVKAKPTKPFSAKGKEIYSKLAGEPIETVQDLTNAIKSGKINPSDIKVDYVVINGKPVIANTRMGDIGHP